jgi:pilus assembly protein CpaE
LSSHRYHFHELANNIHRLDAQLLEGFLQHHESGLDVLPAPENCGTVVPASPTALNHTLAFLRDIYDVVIIDCAPGLSGGSIITMEQADAIFLVATPELAAIRNLARYLDHLHRHNCPDDKIKVVINRYSKKAAITEDKIQKALNRSVSLLIPNCYQDVIAALNAGQPIPYQSRSELVIALRDWAQSLTGRSEAAKVEPAKRKFGILGL